MTSKKASGRASQKDKFIIHFILVQQFKFQGTKIHDLSIK